YNIMTGKPDASLTTWIKQTSGSIAGGRDVTSRQAAGGRMPASAVAARRAAIGANMQIVRHRGIDARYSH
uniref:hypothetical protein n=1 Tax=Acinetobacter baumannii TaxID=470 RepID=UPI001C08B526